MLNYRKLHTAKVVLSLVFVLVLMTGLFACTPSTTEPTSPAAEEPVAPAEEKTITVWGFVWTADWLDAIGPGFEATHPGVKVKVERFEYDAYQDMVLTTLASGEGVPDVVTLDPMWAGDLIRGETVLPLDKATTELNTADFVQGGWDLYKWKDVQYGIPLDLDFNLLFYRKDVYEKAMQTLGMAEFPTNTDDYLKLADQVVKDTGKPAVILFQGDYYAWYQSFLAPMGGDLISADLTEYVYNSDEAVKALELYSDVANKYKVGSYGTLIPMETLLLHYRIVKQTPSCTVPGSQPNWQQVHLIWLVNGQSPHFLGAMQAGNMMLQPVEHASQFQRTQKNRIWPGNLSNTQ